MPKRKGNGAAPAKEGRGSAGGAAAGGGFNFQAGVTAIAGAHLIRGVALGWLPGIMDDVPVAVSAESGGAGDDIRLELAGGEVVEVQVKKGLRGSSDLWSALLLLARGVVDGSIAYGVLVASPCSSRSIPKLGGDLRRLADGRTDALTDLGQHWHTLLGTHGIPVEAACARLRIHTVHATETDGASVTSVKAVLAGVDARPGSSEMIWGVLYRDAHRLIECRGRWTSLSLRMLLGSSGTILAQGSSLLQAEANVCDWVQQTNQSFSVVGIQSPLLMSVAWIQLQAVVIDVPDRDDNDVAAALSKYQKGRRSGGPGHHDEELSGQWIGRFYTRAVVVAGPGTGKTTLLTRLAQVYATDGYPVLKVKLSAVAARMNAGSSFLESALHLGLSGSGVPEQVARNTGLRNWVLLCDGLDECHSGQEMVAVEIAKCAAGYPDLRVVVATRPIGYHTSALAAWRHYELLTFDDAAAATHLAILLRAAASSQPSIASRADAIASVAMQKGPTSRVVWTPHLLGMAASLLLRGGELGATPAALYRSLFQLAVSASNRRTKDTKLSEPVLASVLDHLGWQVISNPLVSLEEMQQCCAGYLAEELKLSRLQALDIVSNAAAYWQDVGLVEHLHHAQRDLLAFMHKTFAEFAAARFLHGRPPAWRQAMIEKHIGSDNWSEVLNFAAELGLGEEIIDAVFRVAPVKLVGATSQALRIANGGHLTASTLRLLLERAWRIVASEDQEDSYAIGAMLADLAALYRDEVGIFASVHLADRHSWTRLVAWTCAAEAGEAHYRLDEAVAAVKEGCANTDRPRSLLLGGIGLGRRTADVHLVQRLALRIGARLRLERSESEIDALLEALEHGAVDTVSFQSELTRTVGKLGKSASGSYEQFINNMKSMWASNDSAKGTHAEQALTDVILGALASPTRISRDPALSGQPMLQFSAFLRLTGFLETSYSDLGAWTKPVDMSMAHQVIRALASVSGLDREVLGWEAGSLLARTLEGGSTAPWWLAFDPAKVDVPDPAWERVRALDLERGKLVEAVLHPSSWFIALAANLLDGLGPASEVEVRHLLRESRGYSFAGAAYLARQLGGHGAELLIERAAGSQVEGLEHVFEQIRELAPPLTDSLRSALEHGLFAPNALIAKAAASLAIDLSRAGVGELWEMSARAMAHWSVHEGPYPQMGGVVPDSPRSLLLEAMACFDECVDEVLFEALGDQRSDVRDAAVAALVRRTKESLETGAYVVDHALGKTMPAKALHQILSKSAMLAVDDVKRLEPLLRDADPAYRRAACGLLETHYLTEEAIKQKATHLLDDSEREIRRVAGKALERIGAPFGGEAM
ncbi:hypothetical protein VC279_06000 [Xanthomonas sp. WHRI 10064A]|uniref:hypothetical protein n=1 Tax=unclassified Xanthomonas TaxID=2643310 RepID=UPI002B23906F|nr:MULTISPECIES: hypothetical protein [unclassified Xanthomonas]MEA9585864.1 hypothetical protein [Xanthomonas sp. WHRI 10064B]MEA9614291.1 hypothetical protein [Xanthomonas sp. WHRI 10064A]